MILFIYLKGGLIFLSPNQKDGFQYGEIPDQLAVSEIEIMPVKIKMVLRR
jgi:hypothetical protein